jgi:alpha-beta hydrolase superfamily lysophospholipase
MVERCRWGWDPCVELFRRAGYAPLAPGWPFEPDTVAEAREHPEYVANIGINDATGHYADIIDGLDAPPVIIGHSFGGLIAEKPLGQGVRGSFGSASATQ